MPRGVRTENRPLEQQISDLQSKIAETENSLENMKTKLGELKALKDKEDLETLLSVIRESGKSVQDILGMIHKSA
jgi:prefoldin subunit 5